MLSEGSNTCTLCFSEQEDLKRQVLERDTEEWQRAGGFTGLQRVGGVDLSFIKGDDVTACAQLVVLSYPQLEVCLTVASVPESHIV